VWLFPWSFSPRSRLRELPFPSVLGAKNGPDMQARMLLMTWAGVIWPSSRLESGSRLSITAVGAWPAICEWLLGLGIALCRGI